MDDGSDPPHLSDPKIVEAASKLERLTIVPTNEFRPWTSSLARNMGARMAHGDWLFMHDGDFFIQRGRRWRRHASSPPANTATGLGSAPAWGDLGRRICDSGSGRT